jgi:hypothetical protein
MYSTDGRFSLNEAGVALHVLSTVDPRLRGVTIDLPATFTNTFVDAANAAIAN